MEIEDIQDVMKKKGTYFIYLSDVGYVIASDYVIQRDPSYILFLRNYRHRHFRRIRIIVGLFDTSSIRKIEPI